MAVGTVGFAYRAAVVRVDSIITASSGCSCSTDDSCFSAGYCCYPDCCCACSRMPVVVTEARAGILALRRS